MAKALIKEVAGMGVFCIRKSGVRLEGFRGRLVLAFPGWYLDGNQIAIRALMPSASLYSS